MLNPTVVNKYLSISSKMHSCIFYSQCRLIWCSHENQ